MPPAGGGKSGAPTALRLGVRVSQRRASTRGSAVRSETTQSLKRAHQTTTGVFGLRPSVVLARASRRVRRVTPGPVHTGAARRTTHRLDHAQAQSGRNIQHGKPASVQRARKQTRSRRTASCSICSVEQSTRQHVPSRRTPHHAANIRPPRRDKVVAHGPDGDRIVERQRGVCRVRPCTNQGRRNLGIWSRRRRGCDVDNPRCRVVRALDRGAAAPESRGPSRGGPRYEGSMAMAPREARRGDAAAATW